MEILDFGECQSETHCIQRRHDESESTDCRKGIAHVEKSQIFLLGGIPDGSTKNIILPEHLRGFQWRHSSINLDDFIGGRFNFGRCMILQDFGQCLGALAFVFGCRHDDDDDIVVVLLLYDGRAASKQD